MTKFILIVLLAVFSFANDIFVTVDYGKEKLVKKVHTSYESGKTSALELLKKVSVVKVSKGKYKFANSIDGVKSKHKTYGWFYMLDGKATKIMASDFILKNEKSMTWSYKVSACY